MADMDIVRQPARFSRRRRSRDRDREAAIETLGAPIYVRHEVVHNKFVVDATSQRGAVFVEELDEVPDGNMVIFSAHGVSQAVRAKPSAAG